ncbi:uncharacterized [Tachysurus ichikawai]
MHKSADILRRPFRLPVVSRRGMAFFGADWMLGGNVTAEGGRTGSWRRPADHGMDPLSFALGRGGNGDQ